MGFLFSPELYLRDSGSLLALSLRFWLGEGAVGKCCRDRFCIRHFPFPLPTGPEESGTDEARAEGQAAEEKKEPKV